MQTYVETSKAQAIQVGAEAGHRPYCQAMDRSRCAGAEQGDVVRAEAVLNAAHAAGHIVWADDLAVQRDRIRACVTALKERIDLGDLPTADAELLCRLRDVLGSCHS